MDSNRIMQILRMLSSGTDPFTGEALPAISPYQHPDVVRALFHAVHVLEDRPIAARAAQPVRTDQGNAGKPWAKEEDERLLAAYDAGQAIETLARLHGRSKLAIEARLAKFGRVAMPVGVRTRDPRPTDEGSSAPPAATIASTTEVREGAWSRYQAYA